MPIQKRWTLYTRANVEKLPKDLCGAYEIADKNKRVIDTGGSNSPNVGVRGRLIDRLIHKKHPEAKYFRYVPEGLLITGKELEAEHAEKHLKKYGKKPKHTKRSPRPYKSPFSF